MNPLVLLALAGGGYILYQQSQGKSVFGGEECPAKLQINGAAFAREVIPGYENGGVLTQAMNDAGIVVRDKSNFSFEGKEGKLKKFLSANYTKKLADKAFRKLVPSGCKKTDKDVIVCLAAASSPDTDDVIMVEMHLPSFWILIHVTIIGTFAAFFASLRLGGDKDVEEKIAKCQALIGKELEWWRKTMELEGGIPDDVTMTQVPRGEHKPADLPPWAFRSLMNKEQQDTAEIGGWPQEAAGNGGRRPAASSSGGLPGKYGPMGSQDAYVVTDKVESNHGTAVMQLMDAVERLDPQTRALMQADKRANHGLVISLYAQIVNAYTDPSVGQKIERRPPASDTQTRFEFEGPGNQYMEMSPAGIMLLASAMVERVLFEKNDFIDLPGIAVDRIVKKGEELFGPGMRNASLPGDQYIRDVFLSLPRGTMNA